jgi:diketogulonate reductase-like aldo/keto reductase
VFGTQDWLALGGRGIDTAYSYHNQNEVGTAVKSYVKGGGKRSDVFITTKINPGRYAKNCSQETGTAAIQENMKELGISYVDLMLIHFPCSSEEGNQAVWKSLEQAKAQGLAKAIGVSNHKKKDIDAILSLGGSTPAINQCQMSVGSHDDQTISYCKSHNITYEVCSKHHFSD